MKNKFFINILIISFVLPFFVGASDINLDYINLQLKKINSQISQLEQSKKQAEELVIGIISSNGGSIRTGEGENALKNAGSKYQNQIDLLEIDKEYWTKLKKQYREEQEQDKILQEKINSVSEPQVDYNTGCINQIGQNAYYNETTGKCTCNSGYYIGKNNKCISLSILCSEKYGAKGFIKDGQCYYCNEGYSYDKTKKDCVSKEAIKPIEKTISTEEKPDKDLSYDRYLKQKEDKIVDNIKTENIKNNSLSKKVVTFFKRMLFWGSKN